MGCQKALYEKDRTGFAGSAVLLGGAVLFLASAAVLAILHLIGSVTGSFYASEYEQYHGDIGYPESWRGRR